MNIFGCTLQYCYIKFINNESTYGMWILVHHNLCLYFVKKIMQTLILDHFIAVSNHNCIFPYQLIYVKCKFFSVQSCYK